MAIFEIVSTVTYQSLMHKSKDDLARWIMHLLNCRDESEAARVRRVTDLLEANNRYQEEARAARALLKAKEAEAAKWRPTHRHRRRRSTYAVIGTASLQSSMPAVEGARLTIYRDRDGGLWARPVMEFNDGRFESLEKADV